MSSSQFLFQQTVLVIDDPRGFERLIREGLFSCSAVFEFCPSHEDEAAEALRKEAHDLVMLSHDFQTGSITDFVARNAEILGRIPCICMGLRSEWPEDLSLLLNHEVLDRAQLPMVLERKFEQMVRERQRRMAADPRAKA